MILEDKDDRDVIAYAFRYTLGRHSYAPSLMRNKLDKIWDQLYEEDRNQILKEIEEHRVRLDRMYEGKKTDFDTKYDLSEWVAWREKKLSKVETPVEDDIRFDGDIDKMDKPSAKRVLKLFCETPGKELDPECQRYMTAYGRRFGGCGEVYIAAIAEYVRNNPELP